MRPLQKLRDRLNDWLDPAPVVKVPSLTEQARRGVGWCIWYGIALMLRMFAYFLKP